MCAVYMILVGGRQRYFDDEDHWSDGRERRRDDFHGLQDPARFFSIRRDFKERNWSTVVIKNRSVYMTQDRLLSCCSLWTQLWVCPEGSWNVGMSYTCLGTHLPSSPASSSLAASIHEMPPLEAWLSCLVSLWVELGRGGWATDSNVDATAMKVRKYTLDLLQGFQPPPCWCSRVFCDRDQDCMICPVATSNGP